jgi:multidrug efflux pump subunit AcrB
MSRDAPRGPIAWMVGNRVTPNLLMIICLLGGIFLSLRIKKEVFPEFDLDRISVRVPYPGASPEEVEQGICLSVEEAVRGIEGVKEITATASEGSGRVSIELLIGADAQRVYQDVQQEVDRIRTFPEEAERAQVELDARRHEVLDLQVYGDASEAALRELAEEVRDRLLQQEGITMVELDGARDHEVMVEVSRESLRRYGLTLESISRAIGLSSVELPSGSLETRGGEILLRLRERRDWARDFAEIPIVTTAQGTIVRLSDIASVTDDFEDTNRVRTFEGKPSVGIEVYRVGEETPIGVSEAVHEAMAEIVATLPTGVNYAINSDRSDIYRQRLHLLLRNALLGLCLVLAVLGLFLEFRLAFWVTMGIPISFLGAFLFLPMMGVTINMISMFAFIVALGIVVDDAIVAGENIYEARQRGLSFAQAAVEGAREVVKPITYSILTNMVAFMPLMFVPGMMGKIWAVIPLVVITVFAISWIEALFILPAHLAHAGRGYSIPLVALLARGQQAFSRGFTRFVENVYGPFLRIGLRGRYVTMALGVVLLMITVAYAMSGRMGFILMPKVESDRAVVTARLPYGSPLEKVETVRDRLLAAAQTVREDKGGDLLVEGIRARIDENVVELTVYLTAPTVRPISTTEYTSLWREQTGEIAGLESLRFESDRGGPGRGPSVTVELSHRDIEVLDKASAALAARLLEFDHVKDVNDGYTPGKTQLDLRLKSEGRSLGLTSREVARQVRDAFYGSEALRQQRGRNEVKVRVRLPESQRVSEYDIEELLIRTPAGKHVPLLEVAEVTRGNAYTSISRRHGKRTVTVTANVSPIRETNGILESIKADILPALTADYPGLSSGFEGRQAEMRDSLAVLKQGFLFAMMAIYFLLAVPFKSYFQPLVVMMAIPFGVVGAVFGHLIMGYSMSLISLMGVVALSGVVVNDALVMIDYANRRREEGMSAFDAILTTLTTFGGLAPMIFETSRQARFMIPMALSLGYGIVFATAITLIIVPCLYMILEDILGVARWVMRARRKLFVALGIGGNVSEAGGDF